MTNVRVIKPALAALVAAAACVGGLAFSSAQPAQADTYSDLINAQNQHAASVQREAELKQQLAGASQDLANKVLELDDLTNNKIVAAQAKVTQANEDAATAQDEADAASGRLSAAQKDKETLEEQIKQTGKDYDDAHAAVAQLARDEMHGSNASDVMSVVTGATSTQDFVNSMQSRDALSRNEANAASSAATSLSTSKNRGERLAAIEKQIAVLKTQADEKAASAQTAAETAQSERDALDKLRQEGEERRDELSSMIDSLDSQSAKQAAQTVLIASQVDSYNRQYQKEQQDAANRVDTGNQGGTPSTPVTPAPAPAPAPAPEPERAPERGSPEWTAYRPGYRYPPGWRRPAVPSGTDDCRNRPGKRSVRSGPPAWRIGNPDCRSWKTVRHAFLRLPGAAYPKRHVRFARFRRRSVRKRPSHRPGS